MWMKKINLKQRLTLKEVSTLEPTKISTTPRKITPTSEYLLRTQKDQTDN